MDIATRDKQSYYRAGLLGLRGLQDRGLSATRFSPDAEARWKAFRGDLTDADRVDLLLRDGAAVHPLAFSAAAIFALPDLATDEPFGRSWASLSASEAGALLRETVNGASTTSASISSVLAEFAKVWSLEWRGTVVAQVSAASRIVAAGAGAIVALADHMAGRTEMDFTDQVLLVSDRPGERQLLGLAAALLGSRTRPRWLAPDASAEDAVKAKFERCTAVIVSPDADPKARAGAERMGGALGA
jgi:hypothetical protein